MAETGERVSSRLSSEIGTAVVVLVFGEQYFAGGLLAGTDLAPDFAAAVVSLFVVVRCLGRMTE